MKKKKQARGKKTSEKEKGSKEAIEQEARRKSNET